MWRISKIFMLWLLLHRIWVIWKTKIFRNGWHHNYFPWNSTRQPPHPNLLYPQRTPTPRIPLTEPLLPSRNVTLWENIIISFNNTELTVLSAALYKIVRKTQRGQLLNFISCRLKRKFCNTSSREQRNNRRFKEWILGPRLSRRGKTNALYHSQIFFVCLCKLSSLLIQTYSTFYAIIILLDHLTYRRRHELWPMQ